MRKIQLDEELVKKMYESGMSCGEIAELYETIKDNIRNRLLGMGLKLRNRSECMRGRLVGEKNGSWRGGWSINHYGYEVSFRKNGKQRVVISKHRMIMEGKLGRKLLPIEIVHHIDKVRNNNDPDNLDLFENQSQHTKHHSELRKVTV